MPPRCFSNAGIIILILLGLDATYAYGGVTVEAIAAAIDSGQTDQAREWIEKLESQSEQDRSKSCQLSLLKTESFLRDSKYEDAILTFNETDKLFRKLDKKSKMAIQSGFDDCRFQISEKITSSYLTLLSDFETGRLDPIQTMDKFNIYRDHLDPISDVQAIFARDMVSASVENLLTHYTKAGTIIRDALKKTAKVGKDEPANKHFNAMKNIACSNLIQYFLAQHDFESAGKMKAELPELVDLSNAERDEIDTWYIKSVHHQHYIDSMTVIINPILASIRQAVLASDMKPIKRMMHPQSDQNRHIDNFAAQLESRTLDYIEYDCRIYDIEGHQGPVKDSRVRIKAIMKITYGYLTQPQDPSRSAIQEVEVSNLIKYFVFQHDGSEWKAVYIPFY